MVSPSFRDKASKLVDLTSLLFNPISDHHHQHHQPDDVEEEVNSNIEVPFAEEGHKGNVNGPDTSSFTAFLYSLLSSPDSSTLSPEQKVDTNRKIDEHGVELVPMKILIDTATNINLPDKSESSLLLSEKTRSSIYVSLPALVQGKKWVLLYSTWRHGISLSTLYRRSMTSPGLSLLVVGDRKGAIFGGLVEAPLKPTDTRKYQGTNSTFVFTNTSGRPVVFRPTGANRYFTLCSTDFLALGGGGHFALYLDGDLLHGSSSVSETFGNPCLAKTEEFDVKEIELWGFTHGSKYEESIAFSQAEAPGICRWDLF